MEHIFQDIRNKAAKTVREVDVYSNNKNREVNKVQNIRFCLFLCFARLDTQIFYLLSNAKGSTTPLSLE